MNPVNTIIIGSGGREHALYWKIKQSLRAGNVFVLPGNGGIPDSRPVDISDFSAIKMFCEKEDVSLIVVGPEVPLAGGISDFFDDTEITVFGPCSSAARLEGSKVYAKEFMQMYGVETAGYSRVTGRAEAEKVLKGKTQCVMKYDGLAAGKGVFVCTNEAEITQALDSLDTEYGSEATILIEELLVGDEISIIGITDGDTIQLLSASQDHKQAYDNDEGPNTGGMGAFTPVPFFDKKLKTAIWNDIVAPTMRGLKNESYRFVGVVYFGIMVTADGPKLLEYNVRFGDPEAEVILPALKSDLLDILLACFDGSLASKQLEFHEGTFVDLVLASEGYPGAYDKGKKIYGIDLLDDETLLFHAGTGIQDGALVTSGGRVMNVVSHGRTRDEAIQKVYAEASKISFDGKQFRSDIGKRPRVVHL